jgi:hypothetical protein
MFDEVHMMIVRVYTHAHKSLMILSFYVGIKSFVSCSLCIWRFCVKVNLAASVNALLLVAIRCSIVLRGITQK